MNTKYMYMIFSLIALTGTSCFGTFQDLSLLSAALKGDLTGVNEALARGADVNALSTDRQTALMLAANLSLYDANQNMNRNNFNNKLPIINALLAHVNAQGKKDIQIDATDNNGWTALMFAANQHGSASAVLALIGAQANLNIKDSKGNTALLLAIHSGCPGSATELSNKGANICNLSPADLNTLKGWSPQSAAALQALSDTLCK